MKLLLSFLSLLLFTYTGFGQKQNNNWVFGDKRGITFNTNPPSTFPISSSSMFHLADRRLPASVSDAAGNLLFFTNGDMIWDKNQNVMPNGTHISQLPGYLFPAGYTQYYDGITSAIIPDAGNANRYYVITAPDHQLLISIGNAHIMSSHSMCTYSIVDMSLNGGNGDVLPNYKGKFLDTNITTTIAVTGNGICDKWVMMKKNSTTQYLGYRITAAGISPVPVVSQGTSFYPIQMKFSNDNRRMASIEEDRAPDSSINSRSPNAILRVYDFDAQTGILSNGITLDSVNRQTCCEILGMEFSANSSKFYYYKIETNTSPVIRELYQVDLSLPSLNAIKNSRTLISIFGNTFYATNTEDPILAPDNKIYLGSDSTTYLLIRYPDLAGLACAPTYKTYSGMQLTGNSFYLSYSFHNAVPISNLNYSHDDVGICSFPAQLQSYQTGADNYQWNTGATTQAITINQNGTYWVKALQNCGSYRIDTFHVNLQPPPPIADTFSCNGTPVTIPLNPQLDYAWKDSMQGNVITQTGQYIVAISKGVCNKIMDTFNVKIYPPLSTPVLPSDTTFCDGLAQHTLSCIYDLGDYKWSTGATSRTVTIDTPGIYWLESNTPCGIFRDTIQVSYCAPVIDSILSPDIVCAGSCIAFKPVAHNYPKQYKWTFTGANPGKYVGVEPPLICYDSVGNYSIELTAFNKGGSSFYKKQITVLPKPVPRFKDSLIAISYKAPLLLPSCADATRVDWYKNGNLICYDCPYIQADSKYWQSTYQCIVTNGDCSDSCTYKVQVTDIPSDAWLPTAFTPNGDNVNDHFRLVTDNPNIYVIELSVYNRFGQRLYIGQRNDGGWDGTFNGLAMDMGTYFWHLRYKVIGSNDVQEQKGDVMLIR